MKDCCLPGYGADSRISSQLFWMNEFKSVVVWVWSRFLFESVKTVLYWAERERRVAFTSLLPLTHLRLRGRSVRWRWGHAVGVMPRQEDLKVIKAMSNLEPSPFFLRELRKGVVASKKKAISAFKANATSSSTLGRQSGVGGENFDLPRVSADTCEQKESWRDFQLRRPVWALQPSPCSWPSVRKRSWGPGLHERTCCRE